MEIIFLYGLSIVTSLAMRICFAVRIVKDLAAEGYKTDFASMKLNDNKSAKSDN